MQLQDRVFKGRRFEPAKRAGILLLGLLAWSGPVAADSTQTSSDLAWLAASDSPLEIVDVETLKRGQTGYGLSVFAGTEPERFGVEVLGVWRGSKPDLTYLLTRLSGQGLEHSGVLAGMSGSPVFIDEKLVGAVAFSFSFGKDPIAGITPIGSMRRIPASAGGLEAGSFGLSPRSAAAGGGDPVQLNASKSQNEPAVRAAARWVPTLQEVAEQNFDPEILEQQLRMLMPGGSGESVAGTGPKSSMAWTASGFSGLSRQLLENGMGSALAPAAELPIGGLSGNGSTGAGSFSTEVQPATLTGGDAVALMLVGGDLTLAAHGTVTDQHGDSILAFGHPIYSLGPTRLPMAESDVITAIPSVQSSFKLSNTGRLIGVFDQDREAGAHGILGAKPSMVPVTVRLKGLAERDFKMYVADSYLFKPSLVTLATLGALNAVSHTTGFQGIDVQARFSIEGYDDLEVRQSFDGNQAAIDGALFLLSYVAFLELNEVESSPVIGVEIDIAQTLEPRAEVLEEVRADRHRIAPGDRVTLHLGVKPYRGDRLHRKMVVTIPEDIPEGRYYLMVGDGSSVDAARLMIEPATAETLDESLDLMRSFQSRKNLSVMGLVAAKGLTLGGHALPELPASMRSVLGHGHNVSAMTLRVAGEWQEDLETPMEGIHRVDLIVER